MSAPPITVVVVDDHTIVRQGLVALLESVPDIRVVAQASNGLEALAQVSRHAPDVVILDLSLPDMDGIQVMEELADRGIASKVVVLSMHDEPEYVRPALKAGAAGYLVKGSGVEDLVEAVRQAVRGEVLLSPGVARILIADPLDEDAGLTPREEEVLRLVARGKTSREVGRLLSISPRTVDNHRQNIMRKLGVHDVAGLTRFAIRAGFVPPE